MSKTLTYYDDNAQAFYNSTAGIEFSPIQNRFLEMLPQDGNILDFGCGSGRDTKYFLSRGFSVTATDGSIELCGLTSKLTGITVRHERFQDLNDIACYDGIWACSSLLHLSKQELPAVLHKIYRALKPNGIIYASFKYGNFEGEHDGRHFTNFTEASFQKLLTSVNGFRIEDVWVTSDVRPERGDEKWLNCLLSRR